MPQRLLDHGKLRKGWSNYKRCVQCGHPFMTSRKFWVFSDPLRLPFCHSKLLVLVRPSYLCQVIHHQPLWKHLLKTWKLWSCAATSWLSVSRLDHQHLSLSLSFSLSLSLSKLNHHIRLSKDCKIYFGSLYVNRVNFTSPIWGGDFIKSFKIVFEAPKYVGVYCFGV